MWLLNFVGVCASFVGSVVLAVNELGRLRQLEIRRIERNRMRLLRIAESLESAYASARQAKLAGKPGRDLNAFSALMAKRLNVEGRIHNRLRKTYGLPTRGIAWPEWQLQPELINFSFNEIFQAISERPFDQNVAMARWRKWGFGLLTIGFGCQFVLAILQLFQ
ncbi:hypothetical protein [Propylenella binzhouense]|uniref:Uncharacterized protein n=1 Tax=Propylenella binzhouense TaxID=2555902 RepID=A0A964T2L9_9HYPH|nr:hypothetical protein [Propylenella binzhouense]MYZ46452.1 hypothetical protein [Propylenella binzhouense]